MSNIYGGRTWESTPFYFDKIYSSKKEMMNAINGKDDNVFALRYVLIKYCETAFSHDERIAIERQLDTRPLSFDADLYYNKYQEDGYLSHDRKVYRKIYLDNQPQYEEIAILNTTLSAEGLEEIRSELLGLNIKNDEYGTYGLIQVQGFGDNQATGYAATALGGWSSKASGDGSLTAGIQNFAEGKASMALGYCNKATGIASIAMGQSVEATEQAALAIGHGTKALSHASVALGYYTIANQAGQTVIGKYNDSTNVDSLFTIGNGTKNSVSNAFVVYQDGHATLQSQGTTANSIAQKQYVDQEIEKAIDNLIGIYAGTTIPDNATEKIVILTG